MMAKRLLEHPAITRECDGDVDKIIKLLESKPACCRVSPEVMMGLYLAVNTNTSLWNVDVCSGCKGYKIGSPYRTSDKNGRIYPHHHICFQCILYQMEPV